MPSKIHNVVAVLQQRERYARSHAAITLQLHKISEEKAALAEMREIHCQIPSSVRSTFLTSFSPDSTKVASTHGDHKIYICDVRTGKLLHKLEGHLRTPWCLSFHPTSNDILASGCLAGEVRVWHLHGGSEKWRNSHSSVITSLAFHPLDQMLVIATSNELHFWDWSLPRPFASCSTNCADEKVRFVKFDKLGTKLITGIAVVPEAFAGPSSSSSVLPTRVSSSRNSSRSSGQSTSSMYQGRSILCRLMNMYHHIDNIDDTTHLRENSGVPSGIVQEEALSLARHYAEATTHASRLQRQLREHFAEQIPDPNAANLPLSAEDNPTSEREILDSHQEFLIQAFWRTFHRLRSICATLERRMHQLQRNSESHASTSNVPPPIDVSTAQPSMQPESTEPSRSASNSASRSSQVNYWQATSSYLLNVLTRLHLSTLSTAVAHEQLQQLHYRISEILQRLNNVTGYRARLTTLRDQIFEVAERAQRRGGESSYVRRLDLAHCLWLVEMSLQLTQQMQRILHADYRLTQLHITTSQRGSSGREEPSEAQMHSAFFLPRDNTPDTTLPLISNNEADTDSELQSDLDAIARGSASVESSVNSARSTQNTTNCTIRIGNAASLSQSSSDAIRAGSLSTAPHRHSSTVNCVICGTQGGLDINALPTELNLRADFFANRHTESGRNLNRTALNSHVPRALSTHTLLQSRSDMRNGNSSSATSHSLPSRNSGRSFTIYGTNTTNSHIGISENRNEESNSANVQDSFQGNPSTSSTPSAQNTFAGPITLNVFSPVPENSSESLNQMYIRSVQEVQNRIQRELFAVSRGRTAAQSTNFGNASQNSSESDSTRRNSTSSGSSSNTSAGGSSFSHSRSNAESSRRPCISCGGQGSTTSANSSQPSDEERLGTILRQELEQLTERFRSSIFPDLTELSNAGRVPEIHVVPSAEEIEPSVLLPVHERPRSPPLSAILSGSNDPIVSTLVQAMYDMSARNRLGGETNSHVIHRIQAWDFTKYEIPAIKNTKANVVVRRCKIHNDASVDISSDGEMLVALLPPSNETLMFAVFSLKQETLGQILLVSNFDSNAISLSFSPLNQYIVVGLATPRPSLSSLNKQAVAQIFELKYKGKTLVSSHIRSLTQDIVLNGANHSPVSLNSVQWLPRPGEGLIYGTNRGCLCICKPVSPMGGKVVKIVKNSRFYDQSNIHLGMRQRFFPTTGRTLSTSTQTMEAGTQTTGTQTTGSGDGQAQ